MNSATHISRSIYVRVVIVVVAMGFGASLGFAQGQPAAKPQAQSQTAASSPCGAAATSGSAANQSAASASAAVKNAANAVSNLGSLFGKKKPAQPANQGSNQSANQGANQTANQSADASAACDPTVNAAAGAAAGVASTVGSVESLGGPAAAGSGATPGAAAAQPGGAAPAGAAATPGAARAVTAPAAKATANSAAPPAASAAVTPAPAANQPAVPAASAPALDSSAPPNFSKLPDVNGIQLGMTNDQVLAKIKALYPAAQGTAIVLDYFKFEKTADKPWLQNVHVVVTPQPCGGACQEEVRIQFNGPPDDPRVISVTRSLGIQEGKRTTVANIKAALLQKYGQPSSPGTAQTLNWILDEQGNPLNDPKFNGQQCAGIILYTALPGGSPSNPALIRGPIGILTDSDLKNPCGSGVHVKADVSAQADGLVYALGVTMSENSYAMRAFVHELAFTQNMANQEQQQKIKKAQDTAAPTL
jgi:hypothetical protein